MKILLINPNTYQSPPVPPIGLEYLAGSIEGQGHSAEILDLCFAGDWRREVDSAINVLKPEIAGISVRNIDTVLYHANEFFLDSIREVVGHIKSAYGISVVIGGSGISAGPDEVLDYLGADLAVEGPAESNLIGSIEQFLVQGNTQRIFRGSYSHQSGCLRKMSSSDYQKYFKRGGIAGFETHKGCSSSCAYCLEANTRVVLKNPEEVVNEIRAVADMGYEHFHLCDSEFNEDLDYCIEFCSALKKAGLGIKWAVYMKPANFNRKLFSLMKDTGVYLITLTVDSFKKCPLYWEDTEKIIFNAKTAGIKIAVDFLAGFPYEEEDVLLECLDLFRRVQPDTVSINTYIRLYKSLKLTQLIMKDKNLQQNLLGNTDDTTFISPVFYSHVNPERLRELIRGERLFRIEGLEKGVNYSRI